MGFFDAIKKNITHGGVDLKLQAPASAPIGGTYTFVVHITAKNEQQTVNRVSAVIEREEASSTVSFGSSTAMRASSDNDQVTRQTVASVEVTEPFTLAPGQSHDVPLSMAITGSDLSALPGALGAVGGALQTLGRVVGKVNYSYRLSATADVEGVILDPSDSQRIQLT